MTNTTDTTDLQGSPQHEGWWLLIVRASIHAAAWCLLLFWILTVVPIASDWYASNRMQYPPILDYLFRPAEFIAHHAFGVVAVTILLAVANFGWVAFLGRGSFGRLVRAAWGALMVVGPVLLLLAGSGILLNVFLLCFGIIYSSNFEISENEGSKIRTVLSGKWRLQKVERRGEMSRNEDGSLEVTFESYERRYGTELLPRIHWQFEDENAWGFMRSQERSPSRILIMRMDEDHFAEQLYALYDADGDQLRIIFSPAGTPDAELPENFDTRENDNVLLIFQRM